MTLAPPCIGRTVENPPLDLRLPDESGARRRSDEFYKTLARVFSSAALVSRRPAADIAEANAVPITTVNGWVKEARRRGILPAARRSTTTREDNE